MNFIRNNFIKISISGSLPVGYLVYDKLKEKKYTYYEISKHNNNQTRIWTSYKDRVYDITDFLDSHPGGKDKIMLAAGASLEPYWNHYKQQQKQEEGA